MHVGAVLVGFLVAATALSLTLLSHFGPVAAATAYVVTFALVLAIWSGLTRLWRH